MLSMHDGLQLFLVCVAMDITGVKIDSDGIVHSRLYRKPQKKPLTLHYNSHHTTRTKNATVESMYNTAEAVSNFFFLI